MKKLLIKFRIWLIKKLGGFTEQEYKEIIMKTIPIKPKVLRYEAKVESYYASSPECQKSLLQSVAMEIGMAIMKQHLYTKYVSNCYGDSFTTLGFDVKVLMPDTANCIIPDEITGGYWNVPNNPFESKGEILL